jgi:predicted glutamine amidotransferase
LWQAGHFAVLHEQIYPPSSMGIFNFLLRNGDCLFAHCSTELSYIVRRTPFKTAHLKDDDVVVDFSEVTTPNDRVAVIAAQPLTDNEDWITMTPGSLWLFHDGELFRSESDEACLPRYSLYPATMPANSRGSLLRSVICSIH